VPDDSSVRATIRVRAGGLQLAVSAAKRRRQGDHHAIFNPERASDQGHFG